MLYDYGNRNLDCQAGYKKIICLYIYLHSYYKFHLIIEAEIYNKNHGS